MFVYNHNTFSFPFLTTIVRDAFLLRLLTSDEKSLLHLMLEDKESGYRAKVILLKDDGYAVPQIRKMTKIITITT